MTREDSRQRAGTAGNICRSPKRYECAKDSAEVHPSRWVGEYASVSNRRVEDGGKHAVGAQHCCRTAGEFSDPRLHAREVHLGYLDVLLPGRHAESPMRLARCPRLARENLLRADYSPCHPGLLFHT